MNRTLKYKIKRFLKKIIIKTKILFRKEKIRYPKRVTESERIVSLIFLKTLKNKEVSLYYNPQNHECYIKSDRNDLYIFLESCNIKIINSVYGYDTKISIKLETYLSEKFNQETAKRRNIFKEEVLSKVQNSLNHTLRKIDKK